MKRMFLQIASVGLILLCFAFQNKETMIGSGNEWGSKCLVSLVDTLKRDTTQNKVYAVVEQMPEYPGGTSELMTYIAKNLKIPEATDDECLIRTRAVVSFVVNEDGSLSDIYVIKSFCPQVDDAFIRIIQSMPRWEPGRQDGKPVRVQYTLPLHIHLRN